MTALLALGLQLSTRILLQVALRFAINTLSPHPFPLSFIIGEQNPKIGAGLALCLAFPSQGGAPSVGACCRVYVFDFSLLVYNRNDRAPRAKERLASAPAVECISSSQAPRAFLIANYALLLLLRLLLLLLLFFSYSIFD